MDQTIERAAPATVRAGVNEKQLFKTMRHLFSTSATVLAELMQNARRAGASCVHFMVDEKQRRIDVADDGCGLSDFANLVRLCESGWDEETTLSDSPFGMGFFSVFFACEQVVIRSGGKRMSVSLDDIQNKRAIPVEADPCPIAVGTKIEMHGVVAQLLKPAYVGVGVVSPKPIFFRQESPGATISLQRARPAKAAPNCRARLSSSVCR